MSSTLQAPAPVPVIKTSAPSRLVGITVFVGILIFAAFVIFVIYLFSVQANLSKQLAQQTAAVSQMKADQQDFLNRANLVVGQLNTLSQTMAANQVERTIIYKQLSPTIPYLANGNVDTASLETSVNTGYDKFFTDLQANSQPQPEATNAPQ